ncbi:hypothetical protein [Kingella kingae]|uniref:hypothetical protein n=1 Tax=Kingella kingae TaxID=504 RepID=UPI0006694993|nr:hypothetical protein [Kingella kingae]
MIFIWGMAFFAFAVFIALFLFDKLMGTVAIFRELFGKEDNNNGYCRDLQHEIAAERKHNA